MDYKLKTKFKASGDQPEAIRGLSDNLQKGVKYQLLQGATGTGKTFTMANVIANYNQNAIIIAPNKILASQLYEEFLGFFPENNVELFVSYFDYFRPEMYMKKSNSFLAKSSIINDDIDRMRHSAQAALYEKNQKTIIVATVSCLFGLIKPEDYAQNSLSIRSNQKGKIADIATSLKKLGYQEVSTLNNIMQYKIIDENILIIDSTSNKQYTKVGLNQNEFYTIELFDSNTNTKIQDLNHFIAFDQDHYSPSATEIKAAVAEIKIDLEQEVAELQKNENYEAANILYQRTLEDIESLLKTGHCRGMENYIKYFNQQKEIKTILDLLDLKGLVFIDESHVTMTQIKAMYKSDLKRKETLIENGYRLKSSLCNRPIRLDEFESKVKQLIFVSATPGQYELEKSGDKKVRQDIRPTGIIDPLIFVENKDKQTESAIDHLLQNDMRRAIITTVTKQKAEQLNQKCLANNLNVQYIHSGLKNTERQEILNKFKNGEYQALIGINLLREGIDIPDVSCVMILDADKTGFLRSKSALIQIIGRAARNSCGKVILYANETTEAMSDAIDETNIRRNIQIKANLQTNKIVKNDSNQKIFNIIKRKELLQAEIEAEIIEAKHKQDYYLVEELKDILSQLESI